VARGDFARTDIDTVSFGFLMIVETSSTMKRSSRRVSLQSILQRGARRFGAAEADYAAPRKNL